MSLMDHTAAEFADLLDGMEDFPHNTGGLSMLDEATMEFARVSPGVETVQRAFVTARFAHMQSYRPETGTYSAEAWQRAMTAAHSFAAALRELGDMRIARCTRPAGWGTCNLPLPEDGECRSSAGHTDGQVRSASMEGTGS